MTETRPKYIGNPDRRASKGQLIQAHASSRHDRNLSWADHPDECSPEQQYLPALFMTLMRRMNEVHDDADDGILLVVAVVLRW